MAGGRVGDINKTLYHLGKKSQGSYFHDITVGNNSVAGRPGHARNPDHGLLGRLRLGCRDRLGLPDRQHARAGDRKARQR